MLSFFNYGHWNIKEHAVCSITATSASNATASITVFTAQDLFYDLPLSATTVVLSTLSIGLFGYGLCGIFRPIAVWHVESVYWGNIPIVKTLQGLHWSEIKSSKPLRVFWLSFTGMFAYEFLPAYIMPWLNSVSIPCLASMKATGAKAAVLTNVFGGAQTNEGLGLFSLSFDWQYVSPTTAYFKMPDSHCGADYFWIYVLAANHATAFRRWVFRLLYRNGWNILQQCLGFRGAAIHVNAPSITERNGVSGWESLFRRHSQSSCFTKIWPSPANRKLCLCHAHG